MGLEVQKTSWVLVVSLRCWLNTCAHMSLSSMSLVLREAVPDVLYGQKV